MHRLQKLVLGLLVLTAVGTLPNLASAQTVYRQRYSSWTYHPQKQYYYRKYYYKPAVTYKTYEYHYCVYYPTDRYPQRQNYVYFYNPVRKVYWGRYDMEKKGYSMLAEKDRKAKLEDIEESAFPKPGPMPVIPDSEDKVTIEPIDKTDLPVPLSSDLPE